MRALRLHALAEAPMAYSSTLAHEQRYPDDVWRERAVGASIGCDRATFIAEHDGRWVGLATGLARLDDLENEAPLLVSMFVDGNARRARSGWPGRSNLGLGTSMRSAASHPLGHRRKRPRRSTLSALRLSPDRRDQTPPSHTAHVECEMIQDLG